MGVAAEFYIEHKRLDVTDQELITWLGNQRYLREKGSLDAARVSELNSKGRLPVPRRPCGRQSRLHPKGLLLDIAVSRHARLA